MKYEPARALYIKLSDSENKKQEKQEVTGRVYLPGYTFIFASACENKLSYNISQPSKGRWNYNRFHKLRSAAGKEIFERSIGCFFIRQDKALLDKGTW